MDLSVAETAGFNQIRFSTMSRLDFLLFFLSFILADENRSQWIRSNEIELCLRNSLRYALTMKKPLKRLRHVHYFYD